MTKTRTADDAAGRAQGADPVDPDSGLTAIAQRLHLSQIDQNGEGREI
jgi:hypothetical protein